MTTPSALLTVMIAAVRRAGRILARDFGEVSELQVSKKGAADYVSAADLRAEQSLFESLNKARPGYGFVGEERGPVEGTDKTHT
ncbi:MAG: inositol monophosphatase family protein, partial [Caulobacteraceae bacterium]